MRLQEGVWIFSYPLALIGASSTAARAKRLEAAEYQRSFPPAACCTQGDKEPHEDGGCVIGYIRVESENLRVAPHQHVAQVGGYALFLAGGYHRDPGGHCAFAGNLQFAATELVGIVNEQDRVGGFAIAGQGFGAFVLLEGFPGLAFVCFQGLLLFVPPLADCRGVAPGRQRAEGVQVKRVCLDFSAPDFGGVFVHPREPAGFTGIVCARDQDRFFAGNRLFADYPAFALGLGDEERHGVARTIGAHLAFGAFDF